MSLGIMGCDAAFVNAGSAKKKEELENRLVFKDNNADPTIYQLSCNGEISISSVKNGNVIVETYTDLQSAKISVQSDPDTDITIVGDVTELYLFFQGQGTHSVNMVDVSSCKSLQSLNVNNSPLQNLIIGDLTELNSAVIQYTSNIDVLDFSGCPNLINLNLSYNNGLTTVILTNNTNLNTFSFVGVSNITSIKYPATNSDVSTAIADAITNAAAADGTVYTDSAGAYYSTIADAATAKGWTIEQL